MPEAIPSPFHVLSLSGGGFFGLYSVSVLAAIEKEAGRPLARNFDLLAGTSVGGIIALGLAAEVPAAEIKSAFERNGTAIFSERPAPTTRWGRPTVSTRPEPTCARASPKMPARPSATRG